MEKIKNFIMLVIMIAGLGTANLYAGEKNGETPKLYAIFFHADWCSVCKAITPQVNDLKSQLRNENIKFIEFDFTNEEAKEKSKELAVKLGLNDILAANQGTGFVVIVDAKSKEKKAVLRKGQSTDEMLALVSKYL